MHDSLFVRTLRPHEKSAVVSDVGVKIFYYGRKDKFGLSLQGVCDSNGKFMDVSIGHPGSTSDYLAFVTSSLHIKLEKTGFLAPGLVLYGDNAYVSNEFMATPIKNGFAIFSWAVAVGEKWGLMVPGAVWAVTVAMWAVTASMWTVTGAVWAVISPMNDVHASCGLLYPLCGLLQPL